MKKLKGEYLVNKALNKWLRKNNFSTRVRGIGTEFCWYISSNDIEYTIFQVSSVSADWDEYLNELGLQYEIGEFWTSFLHEVGHSVTWDNFSDEEVIESEDAKKYLNDTDNSSFDKGKNYYYFRLPIEEAATRWAVDFINNNSELVIELINMVSPKMRKFYARNKISN